MTASSPVSEPIIQPAFSQTQRWSYLTILLLIAVSCYIDRGVLSVLLEPIKHEFGLTDAQLGLMSGPPFAICYALASLPLGRLADKMGRKRILLTALVAWSLLTALCGIATGLVMLVILRMGVGAAEGGALPPSQALLADYFPPDRRTLAFAVFALAPSMGLAIAQGAGGFIAQLHGWRSAFLCMALIAAPIALLGMIVLKEPPRAARPAGPVVQDSFATEIGHLLRKRSFVFVCLGAVMIAFFSQGVMLFAPSYMVRSHGFTIGQAGASYGAAHLVGSLAGMAIGGSLGSYLSGRSPRALLILPIGATAIAWVFAMVGLLSSNVTIFIIMCACTVAWMAGRLATVQFVCGAQRRALAGAVQMASVNALGITIGPVATGILSGVYAAAGSESLRQAMLTLAVSLLVSTASMVVAARHVMKDVE